MNRRTRLALALLAAATAPLQAQGGRPPAPPRVLVLEGATIVDVDAGTLQPDRRVVIRGDTIAEVGPRLGLPPADATRTVDASGLFVIPGLTDHHVHLGAGMERQLERAVRGGVTMVQALAGDNRAAGNLARAVLARELAGPEIALASVMAGPGFFTDPRFVGASLGYRPGTAPWMQAVTSETDLVTAVAAARGSGAEVLKLYAMMDAPLVAAVTREAHRQGMRIVAHGTVFPARPSDLVAGGVDLLTHVPYLSWQGAPALVPDDAWRRRDGPYAAAPPDGPALAALIRAMAGAGTVLEPTLWVFHRSPADSTLQRWALAVTRAADAAGIPIVAGTDGLLGADSTALPNVHAELELLVRAGLTPARALAAATTVPARFMGRAASHGRVQPGFVADLVLLGANPLDDIRATTRIRYVVRRGTLIERAP